eukprot:CAMPEP_0185567902 /NCGR_PEP_ID=MMETSP0434-20130131/1020_1 /TAXON_ID=626734 ORGANISM="Favella taraikaensis, Strain Fe Narragansett Bay" /NCGR_SAMPLE_ID=MMETSP0434 /ASSEMBLY_ACC=CAM_ASM_000379 /LENGTH=113 /DNA_ID=CAMNT_0028182243 /DNA_START=24 /DNA_END=365 /DNA_ORIENTATION=+
MKHLAAYCLLVLGGNASPSKKDVEALLKASGVTADSASLDVMMTRLEGKSIPELIKEGSGKMASMPAGGAAPAGGATAGGAGPAAPEKEQEKEAEPEGDVDMGDLFGGGDDDY